MCENEVFEKALRNTQIIRMPQRNIATFGSTNINYFLISSFSEKLKVREGNLISKRPEIIHPTKVTELFEGFGDDIDQYAEELFELYDKNLKILNYSFKNTFKNSYEVSIKEEELIKNIDNQIEKDNNNLSAVIKADEDTWQISIMKFIVDMTLRSAESNFTDLSSKGLFADSKGVPENVRNKIEYLFKVAVSDKEKRGELGKLLNKYSIFHEYEDRFFALFKK